jgi:long-subunit acyl-CoA synthetase (AMP-forming)
LTPSMKLKRNVVHAEYAEQIDALYSGGKDD